MKNSILKMIFAKTTLTVVTLIALTGTAKAQGQFPPQIAMGSISVLGRASATTETRIDIYKCVNQSVASCSLYTTRPLPLNTQLAVPGDSYYRAYVNGKIQEQAVYIKQNEKQNVQLSFLSLSSPTTAGDFEVTLAADLQSAIQKDHHALELMNGLTKMRLPSRYEDGPSQSFLDFCESRTFFVIQTDAPGRAFQFSVSPEIERLCLAVKNGHDQAALAEMMTFKANGLVATRAIDFDAAYSYSKKPKHIFTKDKNEEFFPGLKYVFVYGEPKTTSAGWNVLPGTYHLHWENEAGQKTVRTVNVP